MVKAAFMYDNVIQGKRTGKAAGAAA